jgi:heterodisulfide reductase subunit C
MSELPTTPESPPIRPGSAFLEKVENHSREKPSLCYQCRKCTSGCPLAFAMDLMPNQIMRAVQLGLEEEVLRSRTIWVCASCQTCTTRCPNDIDIAHLMDTLRQLSRQSDIPAAEQKITKFHQAFLDSVRRHGRVFELGMVGQYKLSSLDFFSGAKMGIEMIRKGKLKFLPSGIKAKRDVRAMFDKKKEG